MKKKSMRNILAFVLAAVMVLAMGVTAFAEESETVSATTDAGEAVYAGDEITLNFKAENLNDELSYYVKKNGSDERIYLENGQAQITVTVPDEAGRLGFYEAPYYLYREDASGETDEYWSLDVSIPISVVPFVEITDFTLGADTIEVGKSYPFSLTVKNNMSEALEKVGVVLAIPSYNEVYEPEINYSVPTEFSMEANGTVTITGTVMLSDWEFDRADVCAYVYMDYENVDDAVKSVEVTGTSVSSGQQTGTSDAGTPSAGTSDGTGTADNTANSTTTNKTSNTAAVKDSVPKTGKADFPAWMLAVAVCGAAGMAVSRRRNAVR